jgi:deoxyribose-phosphate aldolase
VIAAYMDSTNLKPDARERDIILLCEQAALYGMKAVCINPCHLALADKILQQSPVKICTVLGFPLGADLLATKVYAARQALDHGADEVDMVMNIGAVKDNNYEKIREEVENILFLKNEYDFLLKIIVETALLSRQELLDITRLLSQTDADFIKTSTGFSSRGVNMEDIKIIMENKSERLKLKASGGIKTLDFALELINSGANRIGSSSAVTLVEEYRKRGGQ